jgi:hypothetical protein
VHVSGLVFLRHWYPLITKDTQVMNGRFFAGQTVEAFIATGREKYQRTGAKGTGDDDVGEEERLERFGSWLEKTPS